MPKVSVYIRPTTGNRTPKKATKGSTGPFYLRYELNGKRIWESLTTRTYTFALADARSKESSLLLGEATPPKPSPAAPKSLEELRTAFIHDKKTTFKKDGTPLDPDTISSYEKVTREFLDIIKKSNPTQITKQDLKDWMVKQRERVSHRTVCNLYISIACFLHFCGVDHKKLLPQSERPSPVEETPEAYTEEEMTKFFFVITKERDALAFELMLKTGPREQELANLEWEHLDLGKTPTVSYKTRDNFRTKTGKSRTIPLERGLADRLAAWQTKNPMSRLVFPTKDDKVEGHFLRLCKEYAKLSGQDEAKFWLHKFRDTFATWALRRGVDKGSSLDTIARALRAEGVPAPRPPRRNSVRGWSADGIAEILRNKKYIGINEWGRTKGARDPETGKIVTRPRPEAEWVRHENPKWRIVSDELWNKVQGQLALKNRVGIPKNGGLNRTRRSEKYLFSGLLTCGLCQGPVNIIDAGGEVVWYGCSARRYKGACTNAVNIRRDRLEEQLLPWLTRDLLLGGRLDPAATSFHAKVQERMSQLEAEARNNAVNAPELRKELEQKKQEASNIADVMAAMGRNSSPTLQSRLQAAEGRMWEIEKLLAGAKEPEPIVGSSVDEVKEFLLSKLDNLQSVVASSPRVGRQILQRHIKKITLTPGQTEGKRVLHVAVEFELGGAGDPGVLLTGSVDASMQQYGFSTITVTGLTLDTSRVRRKPAPPMHAEGNGGTAPASPMPAANASILTVGSDSAPREIHG